MELEYLCPNPECRGDMEPCLPFANSDQQLRISADLRHHKKSDGDMYGTATVMAGDPALVCWKCECVYPASLCRVKHSSLDRKSQAAGDSDD